MQWGIMSEKFINTCLNYYGLDPCNYFSSPGLSWDVMIIMTGIENSSAGYILEVDLEYPNELNELLINYRLAPEKLEISHNMLPKYCNSIANEYGINIDGVNKLVPNLGNKYVLHYKNLQLYLSLGTKLVSVHRILKFKQSDWLKKCIDFNTDKEKMLLMVLKKIFLKTDA